MLEQEDLEWVLGVGQRSGCGDPETFGVLDSSQSAASRSDSDGCCPHPDALPGLHPLPLRPSLSPGSPCPSVVLCHRASQLGQALRLGWGTHGGGRRNHAGFGIAFVCVLPSWG